MYLNEQYLDVKLSQEHPLTLTLNRWNNRQIFFTKTIVMTTRYESAHQKPNGPGDGRPTACQIIEDEQLRGKWTNKTVLITGYSSGLGIETAKALQETGATLYLTARDLKKAKSALESLLDSDRAHLL